MTIKMQQSFMDSIVKMSRTIDLNFKDFLVFNKLPEMVPKL